MRKKRFREVAAWADHHVTSRMFGDFYRPLCMPSISRLASLAAYKVSLTGAASDYYRFPLRKRRLPSKEFDPLRALRLDASHVDYHYPIQIVIDDPF